MTYLEKIKLELDKANMLSPILVTSTRCETLSKMVQRLLPQAKVATRGEANLMGADVVLIHSGEMGWEEALEFICQQCPSRLFVIAPELPRYEALKLEWVADHVVVGEEMYEYEVHELGLSA
jgi:hypothetical protein